MNWNENHAFVPRWKASAAYVTGAHSFKVGVQGFVQVQDNQNFTNDAGPRPTPSRTARRAR